MGMLLIPTVVGGESSDFFVLYKSGACYVININSTKLDVE